MKKDALGNITEEVYLRPYFSGAEDECKALRRLIELTGMEALSDDALPAENASLSLIRFGSSAQEYSAAGFLPVALDGNVLYVATVRSGADARQAIEKRYATLTCKFLAISPRDLQERICRVFADKATFAAIHLLRNKMPHASAYAPPSKNKIFRKSVLPIALGCAFLTWESFYLGAVWFSLAVFSLSLTMKTALFVIGRLAFKKRSEQTPYAGVNDEDLPIYSLLIPLYNEPAIVPCLVAALNRLDYPSHKLDVHFLNESDDIVTRRALEAAHLPGNMRITTIPPSMPRTKPKACNYAMPFLRGDIVTIFDAEDAPEAMHLRKAAGYFSAPENKDVRALQGRLHFRNAGDNYLSYWFALEYAVHFDALLWGLEALNLPIVLGGTSNHFRRRDLMRMGAWDPYNVTEDADLGLRIYRRRKHIRVIEAATDEQAPTDRRIWAKQRGRWIKGHMQTALVHSRAPGLAIKRMGLRRFLGMHAFLTLPILVYLLGLVPVFLYGWNALICYASNLCDYVTTAPNRLCWGLFAAGLCLHILISLATHWRLYGKKRRFGVKGWLLALCSPVYMIGHCVVSYLALRELLLDPYKWDKTPHDSHVDGVTER